MQISYNSDQAIKREYHFQENIILASAMTAVASVLARAFPASSPQTDVLKEVALFCGVGLLVSLLLMTYGLDLSAGFF